MNIVSLFSDIAEQYGGKAAIIENGGSTLYRDFWRTIVTLSNAFYAIGIREHQRAIILLPNGSEYIYCFFALLKNDSIVTPLSPDITPWELARVVQNLNPHAIISINSLLEKVESENPSIFEKKILIGCNGASSQKQPGKYRQLNELLELNSQGRVLRRETNEEPTATINYTYRGLGYPLGAMLTHANYEKGISGYIERTRMNSQHKVLSLLPLYHVFPLVGCVLAPLFCGATIIITNNYLPRAILKTIDEDKINYVTAVPVIYKLLLKNYKHHEYDLRSLTCCIIGGDYTPAETLEEIHAKLDLTPLQGYGLTECLPVICNPQSKNKLGSLGTSGRSDIAIRIVGKDGLQKETGEEGEIIIQSPTVMSGYFRLNEETQGVLNKGWLYTGDNGYLDAEGYLYFTDRKKKIAKVGGNMVDLKEVQDVLLSHPLIENATVFAVFDELWGQTIKAEVIFYGNEILPPNEVITYCKKRLTGYKVPKEIHIPVEAV